MGDSRVRGWVRRTPVAVLGVLLALCTVMPASACQIPVFRYALERWEPDPYEVTVFYRGALEGEAKARVEALRGAARAFDAGPLDEPTGGVTPMTVELIDLQEAGADGFRLLEDRFGSAKLPAVVVHYPRKVGLAEPVWFGALTDTSLDRLLDSPVRKEVTRRILSGDSVVWVLIESGKADADERAYKDLVDALATLKRRLQLPDMESIVNDEEYRSDTQVELRLSFSALRFSRTSPEEELFLAMLMGIEADLKDFAGEPIAVPIFGRGRALYGLTGKGINEDTIESACRNLVGPCSCTVKELNPGVDLLFSVDWNSLVTGDAAPQKEIPELPALSVIDDDSSSESDSADTEVPSTPVVPVINPLVGSDSSTAPGQSAETLVATASSIPQDVSTAATRATTSAPATSTSVTPAETSVEADSSATEEETLVLPVAIVVAAGLLVVVVGSFLMLNSGGR